MARVTSYVAIEVGQAHHDKALRGRWVIEKTSVGPTYMGTHETREEVLNWLKEELQSDVVLDLSVDSQEGKHYHVSTVDPLPL